MKKTLLIGLFLSFILTSVAQTITVEESSYSFKEVIRPALKVLIPMAEKKMVEKEWKRYVKNYNPEDYKSKKEMFADNLVISSISKNSVDVYATTEEEKDGVVLFVTVDMGEAFLNSSHGGKLNEMKKIVKEFALQVVGKIYKEQIEDQKKVINKANKGLESFIGNKKSLENDIESYKQKIEKNKKEITQLVKDIANQEKKLANEKRALEEIKSKAEGVN